MENGMERNEKGLENGKGMESKMKWNCHTSIQGMEWNEMEIWVSNMEDARMKWNGRQFSVLPYQFQLDFVQCAWYLQKNIFSQKCSTVPSPELTK